MSSGLNWRLLTAIVLLSMAAVALVMWSGQPAEPRVDAKLDFTLKDLDGRDVRIADLNGGPLVINFWETFCVPCQYETPELVSLHAKYASRGVTFVGISMHDEVPAIRAFVEKYHVAHTILVGGERDDIANTWGLVGYPTTFFVRADGTIADVQLGYVAGEAEKKIQALF